MKISAYVSLIFLVCLFACNDRVSGPEPAFPKVVKGSCGYAVRVGHSSNVRAEQYGYNYLDTFLYIGALSPNPPAYFSSVVFNGGGTRLQGGTGSWVDSGVIALRQPAWVLEDNKAIDSLAFLRGNIYPPDTFYTARPDGSEIQFKDSITADAALKAYVTRTKRYNELESLIDSIKDYRIKVEKAKADSIAKCHTYQ